MNGFFIDYDVKKGGYLSSEQIDLLSIIRCNTPEELIEFVSNCEQLIGEIKEDIDYSNLEEAKRKVFKAYQDSMAPHGENDKQRMFAHFGITGNIEEQLPLIMKENKELIIKSSNFRAEERDLTKSPYMYDEMVVLNDKLSNLDVLNLGSGRIYDTMVKRIKDDNGNYILEPYSIERDLKFAHDLGKQVRYHALFVRDDGGEFIDKKNKNEILKLVKEYIKNSIKFIKNKNDEYSYPDETFIKCIDIFNELVSFDPNEKGEYFHVWEENYGITLDDIRSCFDGLEEDMKELKEKGISFVYNEPFLENDERRTKVIETIKMFPKDMVDTLGTQMHITIPLSNNLEDMVNKGQKGLESIKRAFADFKKLQDEGYKIEITEFDLSIGKNDIAKVFQTNENTPILSIEDIYKIKEYYIQAISNIIKESGVKLEGISYWSLTDGIDCNTERIKDEAKDGKVEGIDKDNIPEFSALGGLFPTYNRILEKEKESNMQL